MTLRRLLILALVAAAACGPKPKPDPIGPITTGTGGGAATSAATDPDVLPLWPKVKRGTLPNGLTYYVLPHGKPEKRAFLWLAVNAGSVQEDDDQRGLAHFVEHMAFNGTKRFPKQEIVRFLETIGMKFGAHLNAYTSFDETVYQLLVPTDDPAHVSKGLDILHDWASDVAFEPAEVEKERGVVLEEWRLGLGAQQRVLDKSIKVLFKGSRYADRLTIGLPEILKGAPREALVRFYKDWYRPDLMAVIAVGDFPDAAAIEKEIAAKFGDLKGPAKVRPRVAAGVPKADGTRISIVTDRELPTLLLAVYNMLPHRPEATRKDFRRIVAEQLFQQMLNERLAALGRRPEAPFQMAFAGVQGLTREIDAFARVAAAKAGKTEDALRSLFAEVLRVEKHGFTASELDRARTNLARTYEQNATAEATSDSRDFTEEITRNFFEREFMVGREAERDLTLQVLPLITLDELNALARSFGGAEDRVIGVAVPEGKPMPSEDRVRAIVAEVEKSAIEPWEDKAVVAPLMAQKPAPGKVVKEGQIEALGVTEWTLSNGVRVLVKPTDFEKDAVIITGSSPGGLAAATDKQFGDARFADDVVGIGGVGELDAEDLDKALTGKRVAVDATIDEVTENVDASGSARDLETMLQLVHLRMAAPRKDPQALEIWKMNYGQQLEDRERVPEVQFSLQSQEALWKGNARKKAPKPADVAKVDLDKALAFYRDRFGDASDFTFVIVGDVELGKLRPLVETYLASLPAKGRKEKEKDAGARKIGGVVEKTWTLGQEQKAFVVMSFHGEEPWTRDKERDLYILGQVLSIRLREIMREDMSGVYGVGASGSLLRSPVQERQFTIQFGCAPEAVKPLLKAAQDEIAAIAKQGIGPEYLEKVKQAFLRERETAMRTNGFWANWLESSARFGDDPTIILDPAPAVARMTPANVKAATARFLDGKRVYRAILLPGKDAKPAGAPAPPAPPAKPAP
ncbi:MAG TPA: insulinase family protein [Kofleriaceae bacterium]|nr:insulinase family protein [Kofleriaceae bacterium]